MGFLIFPPYLDAYKRSPGKISMNLLQAEMEGHGAEWGEQALGYALLEGHEVPLDDQEHPVVVCAEVDGRRFVGVVLPGTHVDPSRDLGWWNRIQIREWDWPDDWNVT